MNMRILAFPYAYGSAGIYCDFKNEINKHCDFQAFDYPAHGSRLGDAPVYTIKELAEDAYDQIKGMISEPYCLLGYSMGGVVAFELYEKLKKEYKPLPKYIFILGSCEPSHKYKKGDYENYDLEGVKNILRDRNGTSEEILAEDELIELLAPSIKADSIALRDYSCSSDTTVPADCGVTVIRGSREKNTEHCREEWERYLHRDIDYRVVEGDHFFLFKEGEKMTSEISNIISTALDNIG